MDNQRNTQLRRRLALIRHEKSLVDNAIRDLRFSRRIGENRIRAKLFEMKQEYRYNSSDEAFFNSNVLPLIRELEHTKEKNSHRIAELYERSSELNDYIDCCDEIMKSSNSQIRIGREINGENFYCIWLGNAHVFSYSNKRITTLCSASKDAPLEEVEIDIKEIIPATLLEISKDIFGLSDGHYVTTCGYVLSSEQVSPVADLFRRVSLGEEILPIERTLSSEKLTKRYNDSNPFRSLITDSNLRRYHEGPN
jgi:hypothetical protein